MRQHYLLKTNLKKISNAKKLIWQLSFVSIASVSSFLVDIILFIFLNFIGLGFLVSQSIARLTGGVVSFYINRNFSFWSTSNKIYSQAGRFILLYVTSYCLSLFLLRYIHLQMNISLLYAKLFSDLCCFVFNFFIMKLYVYSDSNSLLLKLTKILNRVFN